jgi:hypothetical protein
MYVRWGNYLPISIGSFSGFDYLFWVPSFKQRSLGLQATNPGSWSPTKFQFDIKKMLDLLPIHWIGIVAL